MINVKETFYLHMMSVSSFKKGDIISTGSSSLIQMIVLKAYRPRWWKSVLTWLADHYGFHVKFKTSHLKVTYYITKE